VPDTIEAEVLEIDGAPPPAHQGQEPQENERSRSWKALQGKVLRLDRRWWPLWVLLGIVAFVVIMLIGSVVALFVVVAKVLGGILRFLTGGGSARGNSGLSRQAP
jgi:uncharacterized membrane protein